MSGQIRMAIFDLDGVLVDSEQAWDAARKRLLRLEAKTLHVFLDRVEDLLRLTRQR
jgi:beta-phosphoglucomutase-like phosphatase (HAD superfamily)